MAKPTVKPSSGEAVDPYGEAVIDPTANVLLLVAAANKRQDDLREGNNKYIEAELRCLKDMIQLRAEHAKEIAVAETSRLNAIRQVDAIAVSTAADQARVGIQTLAASTAANAENIRNALTSTAATIAAQTSSTVATITERLAALEKSSYEGKGKQALADPQLVELAVAVNKLTAAGALNVGKTAGLSLSGAILLGATAVVTGLIGAAGVLYAVLKP